MNLSKYSATILKCSIFRGVTESELPAALMFLNAFKRSYQKNEMIFMIGDPMQYAGVVLEGTVELSFFDEGDNSVNMNVSGLRKGDEKPGTDAGADAVPHSFYGLSADS